MPVIRFVPIAFDAILYDGTNGAEVFAALKPIESPSGSGNFLPAELVSEANGILTVHYDNNDMGDGPVDFEILSGQWAIVQPRGGADIRSAEYVLDRHVPLADLSNPGSVIGRSLSGLGRPGGTTSPYAR